MYSLGVAQCVALIRVCVRYVRRCCLMRSLIHIYVCVDAGENHGLVELRDDYFNMYGGMTGVCMMKYRCWRGVGARQNGPGNTVE